MDINFKVWSYNNTLPLDSLHSSTSTFKAHPYSSTQTVFHFLFQYITKLLWAILLISYSCSCDKKERASWMVSISMHGLENKMKTSDKDMAIPSSLHYIIIEIKTRRNTIYSINIESKPYTYFAIFLVEIHFSSILLFVSLIFYLVSIPDSYFPHNYHCLIHKTNPTQHINQNEVVIRHRLRRSLCLRLCLRNRRRRRS